MKILFVCLGNICRSPTAEAVLKARAKQRNIALIIESAGTGGWHHGESPDPRAIAAGEARGYSFAGQKARKVSKEDFDRFDHIFAMDKSNLQDLLKICPAQHTSKLELFLDYASEQPVRDVPDPYYGGEKGFDTVLDLIEAASDGFLDSHNAKAG